LVGLVTINKVPIEAVMTTAITKIMPYGDHTSEIVVNIQMDAIERTFAFKAISPVSK
jgi:hypothetical protein